MLAPRRATLHEQIAWADLVLFHYWNSPAAIAFLCEPMPPARLVLWVQTNGLHPPQLLLPEHEAAADEIVLTAPLPGRPEAAVVPGLATFGRLDGLARDDRGDTVTYIGTVARTKLHPDFFALSDAIPGDALRLPVAGGALDAWFAARHAATRRPGRFDFPGYLADIAPLLGRSSVFGYPLAPDTYASSDMTLQEAMWAGVPPVVLAGAGPARFVDDGETGRVAATAADYPGLVAALLDSPGVRRRLGRAAAERARAVFDTGANVARLNAVLSRCAAGGRRLRPPLFAPPAGAPAHEAAYRFARCLGPAGVGLRGAAAEPAAPAIRDAVVALTSLPPAAIGGEGGLVQFRNHHPDDAALRLWTGIVLHRQGRAPEAEREFAAAARLGAPESDCRAYRGAIQELHCRNGIEDQPSDEPVRPSPGR
jgi:hypothetical protein